MALPRMQIHIGDWLRAVGALPLAEQGLYLRMRFLAHDSTTHGYLVRKRSVIPPAEIAEKCGISLAEYEARTATLARAQAFSLTPKGVIYFPDMVRAEQQRRLAQKHGRKGGNPKLLSHDSENSNHKHGGLSPPLNPSLGVGVVLNSGAGGPGEGAGDAADVSNLEGDELDREIRVYFGAHCVLMWSPRSHADVRKAVEAVGWVEAKRAIDDAVAKHKTFPTSYALRVIGNREASKPKVTPIGEFSKKPYAPG